MTIPVAYNGKQQQEQDDGIPMAQGVWVPEEADDVTTTTFGSGDPLHAALLPDSTTTSYTNGATSAYQHPEASAPPAFQDKKNDDGLWSNSSSGGYAMTTGQGQDQSYWGRFNDPQAQILASNAAGGFDDTHIPVVTARPDDRQIRLAFIRKVYTILSAQLLVTFGICAWMTLNESMKSFVLSSTGISLYYVNMVLLFVMICALSSFKRNYPANYFLLSAFTLSMSYMVGMITSIYAAEGAGDLVVEAVFLTATVFIVLTLFTLQSKWNFSFLGAALGMCLWVMILWGLFSMIFGIQTGSVYALLGSILFSLYIIYDTYMIAERLDPEDYIVAAIELYLDLINLFLYILRFLAESNRQ